MESGEWRVESGEWRVESEEWRVESGEWRVKSGEWRVGSSGSICCKITKIATIPLNTGLALGK